MTVRMWCVCVGALAVTAALPFGLAADKKQPASQEGASAPRETIAKPMSEKEKRRRDEKLRKELLSPFKKWLDEDVAYIISDEERQAFKRLTTDDEREQFIEQFWLRRDPTPDTLENEARDGDAARDCFPAAHRA